jgi:RimJ/RimL family protein N-acetyltransferase
MLSNDIRTAASVSSVADLPTGYSVKILTEDEWFMLRDVRLSALDDSPQSFLARYEVEAEYDEEKWRSEFVRGEWSIVLADNDKVVGLLGVTREHWMPPQDRDLEFVWIASRVRGRGVATMLLKTTLDRLPRAGVHTVWLWILDGNVEARRLYERFGFKSTNLRQPLPEQGKRCEERMRFSLD